MINKEKISICLPIELSNFVHKLQQKYHKTASSIITVALQHYQNYLFNKIYEPYGRDKIEQKENVVWSITDGDLA